ncbi:gephyrin-like molybdotransferase receptor GlpR [Streptomyces sp. BI20]|uniref:divisome protein SepX/GlpR n=1 Tax=Streptomyces sp. BI20 TaxID=3403460 RepID=UPI003C74BEFC
MSSSGLIYAVIVGAWAAYLVPMWLRRQDELNEARPTERFSTAIRLLSGRAGMERRYAKDLRERDAKEAGQRPHADPDAVTERVDSVDADVRAFGMPAPGAHAGEPGQAGPPRAPVPETPPTRAEPRSVTVERERRARRKRRSRALARRRRTTALLFLLFTATALAAVALGGRFLWLPALPAVLLSAYILHLRAQERRRFAFTMDRQRAEAAAHRLRESRGLRRPEPAPVFDEDTPEPEPAPRLTPQEAGRRALVEQTDHAEWVDQQRERERGPARGESWEPVPVPLPTYVTAPVAPRAGASPAADPWSPTRSSSAEPTDPRLRAQGARPKPPREDRAPEERPARPHRPRDAGRTPLFDQCEPEDRPRAANE